MTAQNNSIIDKLKSNFNLFPNKFNGPKSQATIDSLWRLEKIILDTLDFTQVVQKTCDSILLELGYLKLGYRIVVLALIDHSSQILKRVAISQTAEAKRALEISPVPFKEINIPLISDSNFCIKTIKTNKVNITHDWKDILCPAYTENEARRVQQIVGINTSMIYPIIYHNKTEGVMIFSMIKNEEQVSDEEKDLIRGLSDVVGLAVQNAKLYTSLDQKTELLKQVNEQLKVANIKLQELDKLKDEFVSLASHELRTPMTAIKGSLSTILDGYAGPVSPQSKEFLTAAYNENDRLIRLVNNLLNISRIEAGRMVYTITKLDIDELIKEVIHNLLSGAQEKGLTLTYKEKGSPLYILGDEDKTKEILINLIGNALKFTHQGGVTLAVAEKDNEVIISVADTGHGISKEDQDLLFKKFSQVNGSYAKQTGGTGLGLYICKQMIEGMKGKIWLESVVNRGSIFYFSLPKAI